MRRAWILNLDADLELARGTSYRPTAKVLEAMRPQARRLRASLLGTDDLLLDDLAPTDARGWVGRAFCPTPRAIAQLARAGAVVEPHPSFEVLRHVNGRRFCAELGTTMEGARFCEDEGAALRVLERAPPFGRGWRLKRAFGMAGRGQRVVTPGAVTQADVGLMRAALAEGGLQIEPNVDVVLEVGLHGYLSRDGALTEGRLVVQTCDAHGQWQATRVAADDELEPAFAQAFEVERARVARALSAAGYFGPFGIDGYVYRGPDGSRMFQPRSEINARYSMGFAVGLRPQELRP